MRLLFLGDMVGKTGRVAVWEKLPGLVFDLKLDFVEAMGLRLARAFPMRPDGVTLFPFKRLFMVARRTA